MIFYWYGWEFLWTSQSFSKTFGVKPFSRIIIMFRLFVASILKHATTMISKYSYNILYRRDLCVQGRWLLRSITRACRTLSSELLLLRSPPWHEWQTANAKKPSQLSRNPHKCYRGEGREVQRTWQRLKVRWEKTKTAKMQASFEWYQIDIILQCTQ